MTEDTALEFHALKGLPGPYMYVRPTSLGAVTLTQTSKSFLDTLGHEGLNKILDSFDDRGAEAVCTFAFCRGPGEEPILFQGRTKVGHLSCVATRRIV